MGTVLATQLIVPALDSASLAVVRSLFEEYGSSLGIDLGFQDFTAEMESLPGSYAPPAGRLLLALEDVASQLRPLGVVPQQLAEQQGRPLDVLCGRVDEVEEPLVVSAQGHRSRGG